MAALEHRTSLVDKLLAEQADSSTAVAKFADWHDDREHAEPLQARYYRNLIPLSKPLRGEQYAFEVNLDQCTGCKACVAACHSLNGLDEHESWRDMGALTGLEKEPYLQTVTTACHHCVDPACASGCPVLAYEKDAVTGIVRHLDDQCIGCSYCILKCPYDVPKFNVKRGIVRKCDMCQQRLAVGEAPACVQSCPSEAIAIRIVKIDEVVEAAKRPGERLLPGAFDSSYTQPTTRYVTQRVMPASARSQTENELHLEEAHWPLAWMLVLTQLAAGLMVAAACCYALPAVAQFLSIGSGAVLAVGLGASVLHLGQPFRAWRVFLGWRRSWLSREILAFGGFFKIVLAAAWFNHPALNALAAAVGLGSVFCSAMVYVDTRRPFWSASICFAKFFGTTLLLGASTAAVVLDVLSAPVICLQLAICVSIAVRTGLMVFEQVQMADAAAADANHLLHRTASIMTRLRGDVCRARVWLFYLATLGALLGLADLWQTGIWWLSLSLLATFCNQVLERHLFFVAVTAPRMPGVPMTPHHH